MKPIRKTSDVKHIIDFLTHSDMTKPALAHTLGVSESGLAKWLRSNEAPLWTIPAIDGLIKQSENESPRTFLLVRPRQHQQVVRSFLKALDVEFVIIDAFA